MWYGEQTLVSPLSPQLAAGVIVFPQPSHRPLTPHPDANVETRPFTLSANALSDRINSPTLSHA
jgi:hypothetical protein